MTEKAGTYAQKQKIKKACPNSCRQNISNGSSISPVERILHLQRTAGNKAVEKLMRSGALQAKLRVSQPGDIYEQEADRVAEQVMRMPVPGLQRKCAKCNEDEKGILHFKGLSHEVHSDQNRNVPSIIPEILHSQGEPLNRDTRTFMEERFGYDLSQVRVHYGVAAARSARELNAQAYTVGHDIVFGEGHFTPDTHQGRLLLAHELTHSLQQTGKQSSAGGPDPLHIRAFSAAPMLSRACNAVKCPLIELPVGVFVPSWQLAEQCLQDNYKKSFPRSTVGFNKNWVGLTGKDPKEQATIDCFRSHYTAKGFKPRGKRDIPVERQGSAQPQAEPDIFDFTDKKIMEITTPNGLPWRTKKIAWEVDLATELMHECHIGAPNQWATGFWEPEPCYQIIGAGPSLAGKLFFRTWRVGGVLVYMPVMDITREAVTAAVAAAAAKAASRLKPGPRGALEISKTTAAIIAGIAAFGLLITKIFKPGRLAFLLGTLLGKLLKWFGFGLAIAGGTAMASSESSTGSQGRQLSRPGSPVTREGQTIKEAPALRVSSKAKVINVAVIEGLNSDHLSIGMLPAVWLYKKGRPGDKLFAILQVIEKTRKGNDVTVKFRSLLENKAGRNSLGGNVYIITYPYRGTDEQAWEGYRTFTGGGSYQFIWNYLEVLAEELDAVGQRMEAKQVREEVQRLKSIAESNP
jgi:hypothetical protein